MIPGYQDFKSLSDNQNIKMLNPKFNNSIKRIHFLQINNNLDLTREIQYKIKKGNFIIVDNFKISSCEYFVFCFADQLIILNSENRLLLKSLFEFDLNEEKFFFLSESRQLFLSIFHFKNGIKNSTKNLLSEIQNFIGQFILSKEQSYLNQFWTLVEKCLSGYLIMKSYFKSKKDRLNDFRSNRSV